MAKLESTALISLQPLSIAQEVLWRWESSVAAALGESLAGAELILKPSVTPQMGHSLFPEIIYLGVTTMGHSEQSHPSKIDPGWKIPLGCPALGSQTHRDINPPLPPLFLHHVQPSQNRSYGFCQVPALVTALHKKPQQRGTTNLSLQLAPNSLSAQAQQKSCLLNGHRVSNCSLSSPGQG